MKSLILLAAVVLVGCGKYDNSPTGLLKKIHSLAQKEEYDKLKDCIFPFIRKKLPDKLIQGIKEKKARGDGAYSHKALKTLIDNHLDKLKPAEGRFLEYCVRGPGQGGFGDDKRVAEIAKSRPQDITMFDFEGAHILIIKFEGKYKLLFWENLTKLSGDYRREEVPDLPAPEDSPTKK